MNNRRWVEEFERRHHRKPYFDEFRRHEARVRERRAKQQNAAHHGANAQHHASNANTTHPNGTNGTRPRRPKPQEKPTFEQWQNQQAANHARHNPHQNQPRHPRNGQPHPTTKQLPKKVLPTQNKPQTKQPEYEKSGFEKFLATTKGKLTVGILVALILFVVVGKLTDRTEPELMKGYTAATMQKDPEKLLKLFPKDQADALFAKDGAQQILNQKMNYTAIRGGSISGLKVKEKPYLLFFKKYYLSTTPTTLKLENKKFKVSYKGKKLSAKDLKKPVFFGEYVLTGSLPSKYGKFETTQAISAGNSATKQVSFSTPDSYAKLPSGPSSFTVFYKGKKTGRTLTSKTQKIGPFGDSSESEITISGLYAGLVKLNKVSYSSIKPMASAGSNAHLGDDPEYIDDANHVEISRTKLDTQLTSFGKQLFKASGHESMSEITSADKNFKNTFDLDDSMKPSSGMSNTFKKVDYKISEVNVVLNAGSDLYLAIPLSIDYVEKSANSSSDNGLNQSKDFNLIFKVDSKGNLLAHSTMGTYFGL